MGINFDFENDIFTRLQKGEDVICTSCKKGYIKRMGDFPLEKTCCFQCENCKGIFRYDPVVVTVE